LEERCFTLINSLSSFLLVSLSRLTRVFHCAWHLQMLDMRHIFSFSFTQHSSKILSLVLSLELLSLITYHLSSNHSTGSRLRNASNTKSFLSPTTHSSFPNPLISAPSSLYNHLAQPAHLPLSHFSIHPFVLTSNSLVVLSAILPLYVGTISPLPCANLPQSHPLKLILSQFPLTHNL
jgi:hypothetical protein